jgi:cytosine/adenosine deaminase-related metal-dependent hydrolase
MIPPLRRVVVEAGAVIQAGFRVRKDAAIVIEDGVIVAIDSRTAFADLEASERIGGPQHVALPGFVNAHQHGRSDTTVALGVPDAPLECWLVGLLATPAEDPYDRTLRLCAQLALGGITTAVHMHSTIVGSAETYEEELRRVLEGYRDGGVRVVLAAGLRDRGTPVYGNTEGFLAALPGNLRASLSSWLPKPLTAIEAFEVIEGLRRDVRTGRYGAADIAYGPAGPPWCSNELLASVAGAAETADALIHIHLLETKLDRQLTGNSNDGAVVRKLGQLGLMSERLLAAHCVWLNERDRNALAEAGTSVVTNPSSNLRLHAGIAAIPEMLEAGINVALGTDNMSLEGREDILAEARLLRALQRRPDVTDVGLKPATVLRMAAENGGKALRRSDLGMIRPGAAGDVVLLKLETERPPRETSVDELELVVSTARVDHIEAVVCGGRVLVRDGLPTVSLPSRSVRWPDPQVHEAVAALLPFVRQHYAKATNLL